MNRERRKALKRIIERIEGMKSELEDLQFEEEDYRDRIPENLQGGERYERTSEICDSLSDAVDNLEEAVNNIEEAIE